MPETVVTDEQDDELMCDACGKAITDPKDIGRGNWGDVFHRSTCKHAYWLRASGDDPIDYDQHDRNAAASERIANHFNER